MTICNTDFFTIVLQSWTRQELFYKFVSKITNKLVKQLLSMTVYSEIVRIPNPFTPYIKYLEKGSHYKYSMFSIVWTMPLVCNYKFTIMTKRSKF